MIVIGWFYDSDWKTLVLANIEIIRERCFFSSCHERGKKKKFWVPMRNRTSDLRIPRSDAVTTKSQSLHGERDLLRSSYDTRPAYC